MIQLSERALKSANISQEERIFPALQFNNMPIAVTILLFLLVADSAAQPRTADLIIADAEVRTMDRTYPRAEAIAVADGRIVYVGTAEEIKRWVGKNTRVIDAGGRPVLPGFNDAHAHFMAIGNLFSSIDFSAAKTEADVIAKLRYYGRFLPKGRWILGGKLDSAISLTREKIDEVTRDNPVFVYHADPKSAYANRLALQLARMESSSGLLDAAGIQSMQFFVPKDHIRDWQAIAETASNYAASFGITSVQDTHSDDMAIVYRGLVKKDKLKTRVYDCVSLSNWAKLAGVGTKAGEGDSMVRTGCVKGFYDPEDPETASLAKSIAGADAAGLQVLIHSIGKDANRAVLDLFEKTIKANVPHDRRFRVEHAHDLRPGDLLRFGRSKIIPSMQPMLFFNDGTGVQDDYRKLLDSGAVVAFGADAPMRGINPIEGIYSAVNAGGKRGISVEEAVYAYTVGAAFAEFQEKEKGSISVGKLADLILLSADIFDENADIRAATVILTVVNGRIVYENIN